MYNVYLCIFFFCYVISAMQCFYLNNYILVKVNQLVEGGGGVFSVEMS